jgi:predicted DNA repair protein MutK
MASGFFAILDDIGALMDDVAVTTKLAARKTTGILGDDLAVNAEKATGFLSSRELPVLWAITQGSFVNKLIIVPIALLLSAFVPVAVTIALVLGGFYLAYEGVEKIIEFFFHPPKQAEEVIKESVEDNAEAEKAKVKSAVTTDFILSVEIVIIALGTVAERTIVIQIVTVSAVAILATVGVYGIVALIVRMDDAGYSLIKRSHNKGFVSAVGTLLVKALPIIIKILGVVGTIALLLVSGGIFVHNIEYLHHLFPAVPSIVKEFVIAIIAGLLVAALVTGGKKLLSLVKKT